MTTPAPEFDPVSVPLAGVHLVEASAGTGKTHNLAELFARLVAEGGLAVREIVVVTFSEAATQELRGRVRVRLREVRDALRRGAGDDALAQSLRDRETQPGEALQRIEAALAGFDEAIVSTIHGFCRRMLDDDAHIGGEGPLSIDPDGVEEIRREALADWWRRLMNGETEEDPEWVLGLGTSPEKLARELDPAWRVNAEALVPERAPLDRDAARAQLESLRQEGVELHACGELESLRGLLADPRTLLSRNQKESPYAPDTLAKGFTAVCDWLRGDDALSAPAEALAAFCHATMDTHLLQRGRANWKAPTSPVCEWAARAAPVAARIQTERIASLRHAALAVVLEALTQRRRRSRTRTLDALITDLCDALHGADGDACVARLRGRFRAAIVDEFQDTDARQYAIFQRIFGADLARSLFLIGDPKQSIYGFRGGDVFAYEAAAQGAGAQRWTLRHNWRADARLVDALNLLFGRASEPFLFGFIGFAPSLVPRTRELEERAVVAPLELAVVDSPDPTKNLSKEAIKERVLPWLADRIARDLERDEATGVASDIAVLVPSNKDIDLVSAALARLAIPHFALGRGSVFESGDARELGIVLAALSDPADVRLWRAALLTGLLGTSVVDLQAANEGSAGWLDALARRERLLGLWHDDGVAALVRAISIEAAPRLLATATGERRLANLAHLGELLQLAEQRHDTPSALHVWLQRQIEHPLPSETTDLRPASDAAPVKVMTMHRSKGLQFGAVYVPFLWDTHDRGPTEGTPLAFHDEQSRLRVDLGSGDWRDNAARSARERYAEQLRLGYVALTRARHRAIAVLAPTKGFPMSAPARWLRAPDAGEAGIAPAEIRARAEAMAAESDGRVSVTTVTAPAADSPLRLRAPVSVTTARPFRTVIDRSGRVASFTSLVGAEIIPERPDHDEASGTVEVVDVDGPIASWPRGKHVGICVHAVLQWLDFARWPDARSQALLEETARRHGFDTRAIAVFQQWISGLVEAELAPGLRLSQVAPSRRPPELEFVFALAPGGREQLAGVLSRWPRHARTGLEWQRLAPRWQGLMHGFVDLVVEHEGRYFVVDYKTNFLGTRAEDYSEMGLQRAVREEAYDLQYLIYLVALHRHLRFRLGTAYDPARHLGGAIYVFLRGLEAGPGFGIYRDSPAPELVASLDVCFGHEAIPA